jgi:hypothetical protein
MSVKAEDSSVVITHTSDVDHIKLREARRIKPTVRTQETAAFVSCKTMYVIAEPTFCYLIGSYRSGSRLARLVRHLNVASPQARVVVLRDCKAPPLDASEIGECEVVYTVVPVRWGDETWLVSILSAIRDLALAPQDWVTLLSEDSYPLRPLSAYEEALAASGADCWLEEFITREAEKDPVLARYTSRAVVLPLVGQTFARQALWKIGRHLPGVSIEGGRAGTNLQLRLPRLRTPFGPSLQPRRGSDWYVLRGTAVEKLVTPDVASILHYFCSTYIPSEGFVHSVLLSDPEVIDHPEASHFVRFDGAHPMLLGLNDVLELRTSSTYWFARKIEAEDALDELDRSILPASSLVA